MNPRFPLAALLAALLWLLGAAPAPASTVDHPLVQRATEVAAIQWAENGLIVPCTPKLIETYEVPYAGVWVDTCTVGYNPTWLATIIARSQDPDLTVRMTAFHSICQAATHEAGHLLGYADGDPGPLGGIMTPALWAMWVPACERWATGRLAPEKGQMDAAQPACNAGRRCRAKARAFLRRCQRTDKPRLTRGCSVPRVLPDTANQEVH